MLNTSTKTGNSHIDGESAHDNIIIALNTPICLCMCPYKIFHDKPSTDITTHEGSIASNALFTYRYSNFLLTGYVSDYLSNGHIANALTRHMPMYVLTHSIKTNL